MVALQFRPLRLRSIKKNPFPRKDGFFSKKIIFLVLTPADSVLLQIEKKNLLLSM